jgi:hypothetical protein
MCAHQAFPFASQSSAAVAILPANNAIATNEQEMSFNFFSEGQENSKAPV